jgi:hypothetical protein
MLAYTKDTSYNCTKFDQCWIPINMHGAIRIGTQARHWLKDADLTCPTCKEQCDDMHLFLECPTIVQARKHVEWKTNGVYYKKRI